MIKFGGEESGAVHDPLLDPLYQDMVQSEKLLDLSTRESLAFARRTFFRTSFAFIEGYLHWLKGSVSKFVLMHWSKRQVLQVTKLVLLEDQNYRVDKVGKIFSEPVRIPFLNRCSFILRTAAESWDIDPGIFFSDNGWEMMQDAVNIRHRLTHPKTPADLEVNESEILTMRKAHTWFLNCTIKIVNGAMDA
jgi:hypothetical protein